MAQVRTVRKGFNPEAAKDTWTRCVAWFTKYLKA